MSEQPQLYPLTQSQQMMFLNLKYCYLKSVVNICTMMHFEAEMDERLLLQACYMSIMRNQAASLRLREVTETDANGKKKKVIKQYFSRKAPDPIPVLDFSDRTEEALQESIDAWSRTPFPYRSMDTQLYVIRLIKKPDGNYAVFFCVNHVVFDAYSLMATAKEMLEIYAALRDGTAVPKPAPSPLPAYEADWNYNASPAHERDVAFWRDEVFDTEPYFTTINGSGSKEAPKPGKRWGVTLRLWQIKADFADYTVKKELVDKVNALATELRVSPQVLYLLAMRNYLSKKNDNQEDILFFNTVARRATINQKRAGGTLVHAVPFRSRLSNELSFSEACREMQKLQTSYYRHANLAPTEAIDIYQKKFNLPDCTGYHMASLTYQPYFVPGDPTIPTHFSRHSNGAATMPLYLTIIALDSSGDLTFNYEYLLGYISREAIDELQSYIVRMLENAVANPESKLMDLMAL